MDEKYPKEKCESVSGNLKGFMVETDIPTFLPHSIYVKNNVYHLKTNIVSEDSYNISYTSVMNKGEPLLSVGFHKDDVAEAIYSILMELYNNKAVIISKDIELVGNKDIVKVIANLEHWQRHSNEIER